MHRNRLFHFQKNDYWQAARLPIYDCRMQITVVVANYEILYFNKVPSFQPLQIYIFCSAALFCSIMLVQMLCSAYLGILSEQK